MIEGLAVTVPPSFTGPVEIATGSLQQEVAAQAALSDRAEELLNSLVAVLSPALGQQASSLQTPRPLADVAPAPRPPWVRYSHRTVVQAVPDDPVDTSLHWCELVCEPRSSDYTLPLLSYQNLLLATLSCLEQLHCMM